MFSLVNGKPIFYIGKINGIGYTNKEEKNNIIKQLKKENHDIELKDEVVKIDENLKRKAEELAKLKLTYSKTEFLKYLNGEKGIFSLDYKELKQENDKLKKSSQMSLATIMQLDRKVIELEKKINELDK